MESWFKNSWNFCFSLSTPEEVKLGVQGPLVCNEAAKRRRPKGKWKKVYFSAHSPLEKWLDFRGLHSRWNGKWNFRNMIMPWFEEGREMCLIINGSIIHLVAMKLFYKTFFSYLQMIWNDFRRSWRFIFLLGNLPKVRHVAFKFMGDFILNANCKPKLSYNFWRCCRCYKFIIGTSFK